MGRRSKQERLETPIAEGYNALGEAALVTQEIDVSPDDIILADDGTAEVVRTSVFKDNNIDFSNYAKKYAEIAEVEKQIAQVNRVTKADQSLKNVKLLEKLTKSMDNLLDGINSIDMTMVLQKAMEKALETGDYLAFSVVVKNFAVHAGVLMDKRATLQEQLQTGGKNSKKDIKILANFGTINYGGN